MSSRWETRAHATESVVDPKRAPPVERTGTDPYLRWAEQSRWRGFAWEARTQPGSAYDPEACIHIIARAENDARLEAALQADQLLISEAYRRPIPGTQRKASHFTAIVKLKHLPWLRDNELNLRWELALPLRNAEAATRNSSKGLFGPQRDTVTMRAPNLAGPAIKTAALARGGQQPQRLGPAIAVIDFGCPFINGSFQDEAGTGTRSRAVWDQGTGPVPVGEQSAPDGWPWLAPRHFNHGRELGPRSLDAICAYTRGNDVPEETAVYRGLDHMICYDDPRRRVWFATHGGHVLDVAGGKPDPVSGSESDRACSADLIFVQLPALSAADSAGGSLSAHLLDGVRYALDVCDPEAPLAVSISYGNYAGPHDGSSLIESALDELLEYRRRDFAIVLAAGNARESGCHARRTVRRDRSVLLRCEFPAGDTTDTFVEIWYSPPHTEARLQARVRAPGQPWSPWVAPDSEVAMRSQTVAADTVALLSHDSRVPNGAGSLILLAVAPTQAPNDIPLSLAEPGAWEIEIELTADDPEALAVEVDLKAWIERDAPGVGEDRARPMFAEQNPDDENGTLNALATGRSTLVAGAFNLGTQRATRYSSYGPERAPGQPLPLILAAAEEDEETPSIAAIATRTNERFRMSGTSVAAPVLARRVFNRMLARSVDRSNWPLVLAQMAQDPNEPFLMEQPGR